MFTFYVPWLTRSKCSGTVRQERKSWDSKHFFYRKVIVFRRETCCFTEIAHDNADFSVNFQSIALLSISEHLLLKNYTTGFLYSGQKNYTTGFLYSGQKNYTTRFLYSGQKNYTTGLFYSGQKKESSNLESGIFFSCWPNG